MKTDLNNEKKDMLRKYRLTLGIILLTVLLLIAISKTLMWELVHILTPFMMGPLLIMTLPFVAIVFIVVTIRILLNLIKKSKDSLLLNTMIFLLCILILFVPSDNLYEKARFTLNKSNFDKIAREMITHDSGINIALPPKYRNLSRGGGEIQIIKESDKKIVLFYAYRGILDNYSVYAFVPNKESYEILESENWNTITTIDDKWYFCTSN